MVIPLMPTELPSSKLDREGLWLHGIEGGEHRHAIHEVAQTASYQEFQIEGRSVVFPVR